MKRISLVAIVFIVGVLSSVSAWADITKGPYVQNVQTNQVTIMWETEAEFADEVCWGLNDTSNCIMEEEPVKIHKVRIEGLEPDTMYLYKVKSANLINSPVLSFHTAREPGKGECLFAVVGDTRTVHFVHRQVVGLIVSMNPEFVINTGDLVEDGDSQSDWDIFFDIEQALLSRMPLIPVMGNHDDRSGSLYGSYFDSPGTEAGRNYYSFDYSVCHFIILNTQEDLSEGSEQYSWLEQDLQEASANENIDHIYVFFHKPMYSSGYHTDGGDNSERSETLHPLFLQYGVEAVFNGHDHDYERSERDGILYVVAGGGGAPYFAPDDDENFIPNPDGNPYRQVYLGIPHAVLMHAGKGWAKLEMHDLSGRIRDTYVWGEPPSEDPNECTDHQQEVDASNECSEGGCVNGDLSLTGIVSILLIAVFSLWRKRKLQNIG